MKEIERYKITSANGNSSNVTKCDDGHWVNFADIIDTLGDLHKTIHYLEKDNYELKDDLKCVEEGNIKLQARIKELELEISKLGAKCEEYSWSINKLENVNHINKIKAQGIEEAVKKADGETYISLAGQCFPPQKHYKAELLCYAEQLRTKHE